MQNTPLNLIDQHCLVWDRIAPFTFLTELRVRGHVHEARLAHAIRVASARHPMARARLASKWSGSRAYWEIVDDVGDI